MTTREEVINYLSKLTMCEVEVLLSEVKSIDNGFPKQGIGVDYGAPMPPYEDDYEFDVFLTGVDLGSSRVACMSLVRKITGWKLVKCKEAVDRGYTQLKSSISKYDAAEIKKAFENIGSKVAIKGATTGSWYSLLDLGIHYWILVLGIHKITLQRDTCSIPPILIDSLM